MKTIFTVLTMIGLLTFCLADSLSADRLLYEHTVHKENKSVSVTKGHPWWQGDGDATTRDGDITVSAEKRIFDVSESQAKSSVSSSVSISCNVDDGSFVGVAQIKGTADTGASAFLASKYDGIASSGIPDTLSTGDLDKYQGKSGNKNKTAYMLRLPGLNSSLLYSGIKRHGVLLKKGTEVFGVKFFSRSEDLDFDESASTVKQKKVGATDQEIVDMFSPYASASGSAQTNGGASISNQVPSVSADTSMKGKTQTKFSAYSLPPPQQKNVRNIQNARSIPSSGSSSSDDESRSSSDDASNSILLTGTISGPSTAKAGESISLSVKTSRPYAYVYWYLKAPGESGMGKHLKSIDNQYLLWQSASLSYKFGDSDSGEYLFKAYLSDDPGGSITTGADHKVSVSSRRPSPPSSKTSQTTGLSGPSTASAGSRVSVSLKTDTPFSSVYWYLKAPGESGLGSSGIGYTSGGRRSYSALKSHTFSSSDSGDYVITAYIYKSSDSSTYQMSHTVRVK
ncbi:hypothetical protein F4Z98_06060 [Candidatus Poribacteria bacterium]|nr:hypothetical protein [Candidatus Poribacteria bacterium]MYB01756.1 hypothetical protein [Candidatus Poribacteria bacterium]